MKFISTAHLLAQWVHRDRSNRKHKPFPLLAVEDSKSSDSSRTRCSLLRLDVSTATKGVRTFFHGLLQDLASCFLPFPSFFVSPFSSYLRRGHFHRSGGVQSRSRSQWELNSTSFLSQGRAAPQAPLSLSSSDSETLTEGDRPIRAHKGEGIRNNEATMNRRAPCCLSPAVLPRFVGTLFIYFPITYLTSRPPPRGQRFSSFPLRPSVTKIGNLIGSWMARY